MALRSMTRLFTKRAFSATTARGYADMSFTFAAGNQVFYDNQVVKQVDVPSFSGSFGILPAHVPTLAVLKPGVVSVFEDGGKVNKIFVSSGTVTINDDSSVQILAEEAHPVENLDASAAREVLSKAQSELSSATTDQMITKNLAVFDFDHTIINDNSDIAVMDLIDRSKIPKEVKDMHKSDGWTAFMQAIFELLHKNNITEQVIKHHISNLAEVPGMIDLIKTLKEDLNYDVVIISDSNSYFINSWLKHNNLFQHVLRVFTNPAEFDEDGLLKISMYHLQNSCKLSTKNLCKGQIMEDFIQEQGKRGVCYGTVVYCGDGLNDFCPILRLKSKDVACVREKFKCVELVQKAVDGKYLDEEGVVRKLESDVCVWKDGFDILNFIKSNVK